MGWCSSDTTKNGSSTTAVPDYVNSASQDAVAKATDLANNAPPVPQLQIAGFNPDQANAFGLTRDLANAPPISTERVVDQTGKLGAISDYINPYAQEAIQPTLDAINKAADQQRKALGASATSAGAFGDARHGVDETGLNFNQMTALGNAEATGMSNAFDQAMANRQTDLSRYTDVDKTNFSNALQSIQALLTTGGQQQGEEQAKNQAVFDQFINQYSQDKDVLAALEQAIGAAKYTTTTNTNETDSTSTNPLESLLGAGIKGFAGSAAGSTAIAGGLSSAASALTPLLALL